MLLTDAELSHLEKECDYLEHNGNFSIRLPIRIIRLFITEIQDLKAQKIRITNVLGSF